MDSLRCFAPPIDGNAGGLGKPIKKLIEINTVRAGEVRKRLEVSEPSRSVRRFPVFNEDVAAGRVVRRDLANRHFRPNGWFLVGTRFISSAGRTRRIRRCGHQFVTFVLPFIARSTTPSSIS